MDTVFDLFEEVPYTFLTVKRGTRYGNQITDTFNAVGVFKLRNQTVTSNNQELRQSAATLHVHPDESFMTNNVVGNGIRVDGQDYEIIGQTGGSNFDSGDIEHYTLTLQVTDYADYGAES